MTATQAVKRMGLVDRLHIIKRAVLTAIRPNLIEYLTVYKEGEKYKTSHIVNPEDKDGVGIVLDFIAQATVEHLNSVEELDSRLRGMCIHITRAYVKGSGLDKPVLLLPERIIAVKGSVSEAPRKLIIQKARDCSWGNGEYAEMGLGQVVTRLNRLDRYYVYSAVDSDDVKSSTSTERPKGI